MNTKTWEEGLCEFSEGNPQLLTAAFFEAYGEQDWKIDDDDRVAATLLHLELTSRVATQAIGYSSGTETSALVSIHSLFESARSICKKHHDGRIFEVVTWFVLNHHVRPFTARWHRQSISGRLHALDDTDDFRLELTRLQAVLVRFDDLLLRLRDSGKGDRHADARDLMRSEGHAIKAEMEKPLPWGLELGDLGRIDQDGEATRAERSIAERRAIERRRKHYGLKVDAEHATGLALSGGGIRSATFALGVLTVFAKRGLLSQFDYISSVSGGGYTAAFLVNFLAAGDGVLSANGASSGALGPPHAPEPPEQAIGLRAGNRPFAALGRDSTAIGHVRQNSRYLASGPLFEKWSMVLAQAGGLLINLFALAAILCLLPALYVMAREHLSSDWLGYLPTSFGTVAWWLTTALLLVIAASPLLWLDSVQRWGGTLSDGLIAVVAAGLALALMAAGWSWAIGFVAPILDRDLGLIIPLMLVPSSLLFVGIVSERILPRGRLIGRWLARLSAPTLIIAAVIVFTYLTLRNADRSLWIGLGAFAIVLFYGVFLNINVTGLNRHYRRKLAKAFLIVEDGGPDKLKDDDDRRLSNLADKCLGPYPIINAALNVPSSERPEMRGRLTDFFTFTPHHCGSPITGYRPTSEWERADADLSVATAMAISGAAISPRMGLQNRAQLSFWLSLLNVRLGYWLRRPFEGKARLSRRPALWYLVKELLGRIDERSAFLNLSDGGHIENLGVYELLRRRCKFIVVVDGEQDENMTFHAIANLQRLASIDLGIKIEIDLGELRLDGNGLSRSHFQVCRIVYADDLIGYLVYLKLSLTGNEGEFLRRFKLDEPNFPHHPTADQNFTEARFEAYRSLGQHVGEKLFLESIVGAASRKTSVDIGEWFGSLGTSFLEPRITTTMTEGDKSNATAADVPTKIEESQ